MSRLSDLAAQMDTTRSALAAAQLEQAKLLAEFGVAPTDEAAEAKLINVDNRIRRLAANEARMEALAASAAEADRESGREAALRKSAAARKKLAGKMEQAVLDAAAVDAAATALIDAAKTFHAGGSERRQLAQEIFASTPVDRINDPHRESWAMQAALLMEPASGTGGGVTHSLASYFYTLSEALGVEGPIRSYWSCRGQQIDRGDEGAHAPFADATRDDLAMVAARI